MPITRILRYPLGKGEAYEGKNRHFGAKWVILSRFSIIFWEKLKFCPAGMIQEIIANLKEVDLEITFRMDSGYFDDDILETI